MAEKTYVKKSNLEALKTAFQQNQNKGFKFWKPIKNGKYTIRFLPPLEKDGLFYKKVTQHKVGENYVFCPKDAADSCPICERYKKLYEVGTQDAIEIAKLIKPKTQYLYNIIVRDELGQLTDDPTKVFVYMSGKLLYEVLMDYFFDSDYGDLTDTESGYDFVLDKEIGDLGFPNYKKSKPKKNSGPLFDNAAQTEKVLTSLRDLNKEVDYKSYEELAKILEKYMSQETNLESNKPAVAVSTVKSAATKKVAEDDDDLSEFEQELLAGINK